MSTGNKLITLISIDYWRKAEADWLPIGVSVGPSKKEATIGAWVLRKFSPPPRSWILAKSSEDIGEELVETNHKEHVKTGLIVVNDDQTVWVCAITENANGEVGVAGNDLRASTRPARPQCYRSPRACSLPVMTGKRSLSLSSSS